mgnify:FL=1
MLTSKPALNEEKKNIESGGGGWLVYYDNVGRPYYHNAKLGKTQWTPPDVVK